MPTEKAIQRCVSIDFSTDPKVLFKKIAVHLQDDMKVNIRLKSRDFARSKIMYLCEGPCGLKRGSKVFFCRDPKTQNFRLIAEFYILAGGVVMPDMIFCKKVFNYGLC
jgi:hypothetical protein